MFEDEDQQQFDNPVNKLPVMQSAEEILQLTLAINAAINKEKDVLKLHRVMLENAYLLKPKIAGAEAAQLFTLRMENAVLIKLAARELMTQTAFCMAEELTDINYLRLLRKELLYFQTEFVKWVATFDRNYYVEDGWGIKFS